jgi:hypothetical protein
MDLRRLRAGEWITGISGAVLIVSLFLPWYHYSARANGTPSAGIRLAQGDFDFTGWETLSTIDIVLALIGAAAVALLVVTATQRTVAIPIAWNALLVLAALVVVVLVVVRLLDVPQKLDVPAQFRQGYSVSTDPAWGLWLAFAASLGLFGGSLVALRDERLSPPDRTTDATGRPVPPPPEIETLPAPGPPQGSR